MATDDPGFAPAKINLTLHVTGRRADGYHLLDSMVAFADVGDRVTAEPATDLTLRVTGPMAAGVPEGPDNLVLRAARLLSPDRGAALTLHKALPVASGIGGGSSDAAATLRVLSALWGLPLPDTAQLARLGADLPVCLDARAARMTGIGEGVAPLPPLPPVWAALVNPGVAVPTPAVFAALDRRDNAAMPAQLAGWPDAAALAAWLGPMRNDLEPPARHLAPAIGEVLAALGTLPGCLLARMSGSGATCFALFAAEGLANDAVARIRASHPAWWSRAARLS
jgi:4-diphosphocytidyl-2-C-methyl-D-erythritol kinase